MYAPQFVCTGDVITTEPGFIMGHGTLMNENKLISTVSGFVEKVNKLVSVKPLNYRYVGETGDVVVGRISEVSDKKWKVDIGGRQHAILQLSAVHLPSGEQAEVQKVGGDGLVHLHTRNMKYGKLLNGCMLTVPCTLIKRCKQHFQPLSCGIDIILGTNGYIWISAGGIDNSYTDNDNESKKTHTYDNNNNNNKSDNNDDDAEYNTDNAMIDIDNNQDIQTKTINTTNVKTHIHAQTHIVDNNNTLNRGGTTTTHKSFITNTHSIEIGVNTRERICRVRNSILSLSKMHILIYDKTIMDVYIHTIQLGLPTKALLNPSHTQSITQTALDRRHVQ